MSFDFEPSQVQFEETEREQQRPSYFNPSGQTDQLLKYPQNPINSIYCMIPLYYVN
jgi:hypothetical protein